jgi:hypothetical protein
MKKITVTIDEDGNSTVDLSGFHGKGCDKVLKDFADDNKPLHVVRKREYLEAPQGQKERQQA